MANIAYTYKGKHPQSVPQQHHQQSCMVFLNLYDLVIENQPMTMLNTITTPLGFGAFHTGVEVRGVEVAFGMENGIHKVDPKGAFGVVFRKSIKMGECPDYSDAVLQDALDKLSEKYAAANYNLFTRNCNHFSTDLCFLLVGKHIPNWVNKLAKFARYLKTLFPNSFHIQESATPRVCASDSVAAKAFASSLEDPTQHEVPILKMREKTRPVHLDSTNADLLDFLENPTQDRTDKKKKPTAVANDDLTDFLSDPCSTSPQLLRLRSATGLEVGAKDPDRNDDSPTEGRILKFKSPVSPREGSPSTSKKQPQPSKAGNTTKSAQAEFHEALGSNFSTEEKRAIMSLADKGFGFIEMMMTKDSPEEVTPDQQKAYKALLLNPTGAQDVYRFSRSREKLPKLSRRSSSVDADVALESLTESIVGEEDDSAASTQQAVVRNASRSLPDEVDAIPHSKSLPVLGSYLNSSHRFEESSLSEFPEYLRLFENKALISQFSGFMKRMRAGLVLGLLTDIKQFSSMGQVGDPAAIKSAAKQIIKLLEELEVSKEMGSFRFSEKHVALIKGMAERETFTVDMFSLILDELDFLVERYYLSFYLDCQEKLHSALVQTLREAIHPTTGLAPTHKQIKHAFSGTQLITWLTAKHHVATMIHARKVRELMVTRGLISIASRADGSDDSTFYQINIQSHGASPQVAKLKTSELSPKSVGHQRAAFTDIFSDKHLHQEFVVFLERKLASDILNLYNLITSFHSLFRPDGGSTATESPAQSPLIMRARKAMVDSGGSTSDVIVTSTSDSDRNITNLESPTTVNNTVASTTIAGTLSITSLLQEPVGKAKAIEIAAILGIGNSTPKVQIEQRLLRPVKQMLDSNNITADMFSEIFDKLESELNSFYLEFTAPVNPTTPRGLRKTTEKQLPETEKLLSFKDFHSKKQQRKKHAKDKHGKAHLIDSNSSISFELMFKELDKFDPDANKRAKKVLPDTANKKLVDLIGAQAATSLYTGFKRQPDYVSGARLKRKFGDLPPQQPLNEHRDSSWYYRTGLRAGLVLSFNENPLEQHLRDPDGFENFREWARLRRCEESVDFWAEVEKLHAIQDDDAYQAACKAIYAQFVALNAPQEIPISGLDRAFIEAHRWERGIFDHVYNSVLRLYPKHEYLSTDQFNNFVEVKLRDPESLKRTINRSASQPPAQPKVPTLKVKPLTIPTMKAVVAAPDSVSDRSTPRSRTFPVGLLSARGKNETSKSTGKGTQLTKQRARLKRIFRQADKDKNGKLDLLELRSVIAKAFKEHDLSFISKNAVKEYTKLQMHTFDEDQSGTIEFEEFVELYTTLLEDPMLPPHLVKTAHTADETEDEESISSVDERAGTTVTETEPDDAGEEEANESDRIPAKKRRDRKFESSEEIGKSRKGRQSKTSTLRAGDDSSDGSIESGTTRGKKNPNSKKLRTSSDDDAGDGGAAKGWH